MNEQNRNKLTENKLVLLDGKGVVGMGEKSDRIRKYESVVTAWPRG